VNIHNDEGFNMLYAAIFKQAVEEDIRQVKVIVKKEMENMGYSSTLANQKIQENEDFIGNSIKKNVLRESKKWPENNKIENIRFIKKLANKVISMV